MTELIRKKEEVDETCKDFVLEQFNELAQSSIKCMQLGLVVIGMLHAPHSCSELLKEVSVRRRFVPIPIYRFD